MRDSSANLTTTLTSVQPTASADFPLWGQTNDERSSQLHLRSQAVRSRKPGAHAVSSLECVSVPGTGCVPGIQVNEAPPLPHTPEGPLDMTGITLEGSVGTVGKRGPERSWFLSDSEKDDERLPGGGGILMTFSS